MKDPQVTGPTVLTPVVFFDGPKAATPGPEPEPVEAEVEEDEEPEGPAPVVKSAAPPKD